MEESKFQKELEQLINKYSVESESNTPDFILSEYLSNCLSTFNIAIMRREEWYGRNKPSKKEIAPEDEAIMLENEARDHNYNNYCARLTLGVLPAITPYDLLDMRSYAASERKAIKEILERRGNCCDVSRNAYNDWEITMVRMNGCPCGHNGKSLPANSTIRQVRVGDRRFEIGQVVRNDGIIINFTYANNRVEAVVQYVHGCPFHHYYKRNFDIVNL
jgi:hypothetical protein